MSTAKAHPDSATLALLAGGELSWAERLGVWLHTWGCSRCRAEIETYRQLRASAQDSTFHLLPQDSLEWERLEAEMKANIRLGLTAGAIVERPVARAAEPAPAMRWQAAAVFGSLAIVLASGWYLKRPQRHPAAKLPAIIETIDAGIGISANQGAMTLLRPAGQAATVAVDYGAGAKTQYVNGDTGQVTIHQVYLDE